MGIAKNENKMSFLASPKPNKYSKFGQHEN